MKSLAASLVFLSICLCFSCSKNSNAPKDAVSIAAFSVDSVKTTMFKEPFNGSAPGYSSVVLVPDVNTSATVSFNLNTQPSNYAANIVFTVKNDDGSAASSSSYTVVGNLLKFSVPGLYRIGAAVPAGSNNDASLSSAEIKLQVASNIPDNNLRTELKKISTIHFTGEILNVNGATGPSTLSITNLNIQSLEGVRYLTNTDTLLCSANKLVSLDVSALSNLVWLSSGYNELTSLNVQGLTKLQFLSTLSNNLPALNVQGLTSLNFLDCSANAITNLNVQGLTKLNQLMFENNQVSAINVTGLPGLIGLDCSGNPISSLDVKSLTNLMNLQCLNNNFTSLDIQGMNKLSNFSCYGGPLTSLMLSTAAGSYPNMADFRLPASLQCTPGVKQVKIDRGTAVAVRTFNGDDVINNNFDATTCP